MRLRISSVLMLSVLLSAATAQQLKPGNKGLIQDWTRRYVVYNGLTAEKAARLSARDPRAWSQWKMRNPANLLAAGKGHAFGKQKKSMHVDWNVSLGDPTANLGQNVSPAKFGFDVNAVPDCANDFVVYGLDVPGASNQTNLVAFNNLYSSGLASGGNGICDAVNAGQPTVLFAFNITGNAGSELINGSPVLSLDGKKVAFVGAGVTAGGAQFHVLTWATGGGTVDAPLTPDPTCVTSCLVTLTLGTTYGRSPYIDYATDSAYMSDGSGNIYKIDHVFNGTPTLATADPDWPSTGYCTTSGSGSFGLNSVIYVNGKLYSTDFLGGLHIVTPGAICSDDFVQLVGSPANGTFIDTPLVSIQDETHGSVFLFGRVTGSFSDSTGVYQMDLNGNLLQSIGFFNTANSVPPEAGTFDNTYYSDPDAKSGFLYFVVADGQNFSTNGAILYRLGFNNSSIMTGTFTPGLQFSTQPNVAVSELVEFYNPNDLAHPDKLFLQGTANCGVTFNTAPGCIRSFDISPGAFAPIAAVDEPAETSSFSGGIAIDNVSTAGQASSIYFAAPGRAVKLTQAGLN